MPETANIGLHMAYIYHMFVSDLDNTQLLWFSISLYILHAKEIFNML